MLSNKNMLIIGARAGGYGDAIARAAVKMGAHAFCTTLNPSDPSEINYFKKIGAELLDVPVKFSADHKHEARRSFELISQHLADKGVKRLDCVVHAAAGGFPRQPAVMKAIGDILRGRDEFQDLSTAVKRNVYYVNAGSYEDTIHGLRGISDEKTIFSALTYRGDLPYFISPTKAYLERLAVRYSSRGHNTLIAAFPEAWTQSSQFFTGIELAIIYHYLKDLHGPRESSPTVEKSYDFMVSQLQSSTGLPVLLDELRAFYSERWEGLSANREALFATVQKLYAELRNKNLFTILRQSVDIISHFVRESSALIFMERFVKDGAFAPGDVRKIQYCDLLGLSDIGLAEPRPAPERKSSNCRNWRVYNSQDIRNVLKMYGNNFVFIDKVIMEDTDIYDGFVGFAKYTVPSPEENPILKDHFVGMPLFGGHLQMEAAAQLGTFMILTALKDKKMFPILTGTEFPDLNTMAPPGETLSIMGVIRLPEKRKLLLEVFIENQYARSKGVIKGMVLSERLLKKMIGSFSTGGEQGDGDG